MKTEGEPMGAAAGPTGAGAAGASATGEGFVVRGPKGGASLWTQLRRWLVPLASLRLTVWLLAMSIFIVLAGTLAQTQADVWVVVRDYFRTAIAWIPLQVFFPKSFFPNLPAIPGMIPFPGGWLIGVLMAINLVAAHTVRFTAQARGGKLALGLGVLALGILLTFMVVMGGSGSGLQAEPTVSWQATWNLCKLLLALAGVGLIVATLRAGVASTRLGMVGLVTGGLLEVLAVALFALGDRVALGDSSMRILWQLIQGGMAGAVLLVGCWIVFGKRAGIVLLHSGIALLMFSELLVGLAADEAQMHIKEGETVNYVQDIREVELAIVDRSNPTADETVVIPQSRLQEAFQSLQHPFLPKWFTRKLPEGIRGLVGCRPGSPLISDPALPFDVRVVNYLQNSKLGPVGGESGKETNPANRGLGLQTQATEVRAATGVKSEAVDDSSVYVEFVEKGGSEPQSLGVWLCSLFQTRLQDSRERSGWDESEVRAQTPPFLYMLSVPQEVESGGRKYNIALRFKRTYKPYRVKLDDVRFDKYIGTNTAKNYSSDVVLMDGGASVPRHIWMNNPLRYGGETFYQSNYMPDVLTGEEMTGLQVVTNTGWMIPYVSCMIVAVGMLFQFGATLGRFLSKASSPVTVAKESLIPPRVPLTTLDWILGVLAVLGCLAMTARYLGKSDRSPKGFDFDAAGRIPIVYQGRVKPLDTLARNTLQVISNGETLRDHTNDERMTATQWLFEMMSGVSDEKQRGPEKPPPRYARYRVFRIDNFEVLDFFGLEKRKGFLYSLEEIGSKAKEFNAEVDKLRELKTLEGLGVFQRKMLDLDRRVRSFTALQASLRWEEMPKDPDPQMVATVRSQEADVRANLAQAEKRLLEGMPPLAVPVRPSGQPQAPFEWKPLIVATTNDLIESQVLQSRPPAPATEAWNKILAAYEAKQSGDFNEAVANYLALLESDTPAEYVPAKTNFERFYNRFAAFHIAYGLYIVALVGTLLGWLLATVGLGRPVQWATFCALLFIFALHTAALVGRIYISGRPPVTNLYSSAIFIGWGAVLFGLVLEWVFRMGIGNYIASCAGFMTLFISFKLASDGDTFTVMQAVLDTQFWLATHVVCISLGYTATFVAGFLALGYIAYALTPFRQERVLKSLTAMTYGTLCFAILLSFVGTVLGGLWADDSWGRFWGWDPKENGALIIVLWNALVLHARWGGMVADRGLAILAIGGNIATAWSWFGVNELGVGLHSYGFTEGVLMALGLWVLFNLALMGLGGLVRTPAKA